MNENGRIASTAYVNKSALLHAPVDIADNVTVYNKCEIGKFSYINVGCVLYANVKLGKFCSLGRNVEIGLANHPVDFLSSHPFQLNDALFKKEPGYSSLKKIKWEFHPETVIGNDVWIGAKACINSGINIGDGAIIAAGAVVNKDVEPYTIVGGVPAKVIRKRFSTQQCTELLRLKWWELSIDLIGTLNYDDIDDCIHKLQKIRNDDAKLST
jgi:acetyltransferase-like isoleucine patch superfamily enzyme